MKQIKNLIAGWTLAIGLVAMAGCTHDAEPVVPPQAPADEWNVYLSRSTGEQITVALRYDGTTSYGTLQPAADKNTAATWVGTPPVWPQSGMVEVITFSPAVTELPTTIDATSNIAYTMDYIICTPDSKPGAFQLQHLMAQLMVHIRLHDDEAHHYQPTDAVISLFTKATIDYANKQLTDSIEKVDTYSLGTFTKEEDEKNTDVEENWVNTAQVVIPQTFPAGEPCLSFKANDKTYTFVPKDSITLIAGKRTNLYLGVAYKNTYITLAEEGVVVTDWANGGTINGGEAEEQ